MQRAGAFTAKADDPTAIMHNPAGLVWGITNELFIGANVVHFDQSFEREGSYSNVAGGNGQPTYVGDDYPVVQHQGPVQPVPFVSVTMPQPKYALAFGVFAPQGYPVRNYPETVDTSNGSGAPAPQRYDTVYQTARLVLPSVALGLKLNEKLSIGGRASYGFFQTESQRYVQGVANGAEDPGQDSRVAIAAADDQVLAFAGGLHYKHSPTVEIGATYTSQININAVGTSSSELGEALREPVPGMPNTMEPVPDAMARCATGGQEGALSTCVDLALPQTATVGIRWIARDEDGNEVGDIEIDAKWENWSAVGDYAVVVDGQNSLLGTRLEDSVVRHGFVDTFSVRVGGSAKFESGGSPYEVRAGVAYDTAAAPDSWTRLDVDGADRMTGAFGLGMMISGKYRLDIGAAYVDSPQRRFRDVDVSDMNDRVQPDIAVPLNDADSQPHNPFNAGVYKTSYVVGIVGLTAKL
jgi:long-subunit fatty acid transport protein